MQLGMFASRGCSSLSTYADTYSVNVPMHYIIGRSGGLILSLGFENEVVRIGNRTS